MELECTNLSVHPVATCSEYDPNILEPSLRSLGPPPQQLLDSLIVMNLLT